MRANVRLWSAVVGVCAAGLVWPITALAEHGGAPTRSASAQVAAAHPARARLSADGSPSGPDCSRLACVALTFDDGPSEATSALLDHLDAAHAKATFFVVGQQVQAFPEQLRREVADGQAIGNHTFTHPVLASLTADQVHDELADTQDAVFKAAGVRPTLMRPPYGSYSAAVRSFGLPLVVWDVDSMDWSHHDPAMVLRRAAAGIRPGSIILMHDTQPETLAAVPQLIRNLRASGYTLVTVPQLFAGTRLDPGSVYRDRDSAARPDADSRNWHATPPTADQDTADAAAGTVLWRYATHSPTGPSEAGTLEHGLHSGQCHDTLPPHATSPDEAAFAIRNTTGHDVAMYDTPDCTHRTATLTPGSEQTGTLRSFKLL
ncbi:polysaccharide deacetylase family protein [Streptacidiphilus sp. PB12-B1b]|uniref:polysaccharide deacetylase family protein n=1 Tax=Streptacidiphilus sp. PB12-B1b TaxID=2705012 RepID=UPI001CDD436E|nr:polysaccharide deacetylase family protein [Streptacidiphilus sp. PB12-B1b]QMU78579.1 polysaccharide deacetylase family protein [Streptacidiphilus sp. PB12-B1b]